MNVFEYAAIEEAKFEARAAESGYKRITTFYSDLSIAEFCQLTGMQDDAIVDTFNRVCSEWIGDYKFFSEFIICLNWKCWEFYEFNETIAKLYSDLYYKAMDKFFAKYGEEGGNNEEAMSYYFKVTD